jgi:hypothetical protein
MEENYKNEPISAFAYFTAKKIETLINEETNNLRETNMMLEVKILDYFAKLRQRASKMDGDGAIYNSVYNDYKKHFGISSDREGKI